MIFFREGLYVAGRLGVRPFVDASCSALKECPQVLHLQLALDLVEFPGAELTRPFSLGRNANQFTTALNTIALNHIYIGTTVWETPLPRLVRGAQGGFGAAPLR